MRWPWFSFYPFPWSHRAIRRGLSIAPLVWIGTISYGVYLYHWPVFVILDEERTGMDGFALTALRFAITFTLAQVSFTLLERPIRRSSFGLIPFTCNSPTRGIKITPERGTRMVRVNSGAR